jgi:hypothetical protein
VVDGLSKNIHSAQPAMLGYRFQPLYALLVLWKESEDDFDEVSVESDDDVMLKGKGTKLYQLKHSTGESLSLTVKNEGFWKTIRIWSQYATSTTHELFFVTSDTIRMDNPLIKLVSGKPDRKDIVSLLETEAKLVIETRKRAIQNKEKKLPYETKIHGCEAFMSLSEVNRLLLIEKITIRHNSFNIFEVYNQVIKQLSSMAVKKVRPLIAQRLLEWWDNRMLNAFSGIKNTELISQVHCLIGQTQDNNLPDDFSKVSPTSIDSELGGFMEKQINLVNGGINRINRSAIARWRSRNQREKWIQDDLLNAFELEEYDKMLIEFWGDRHNPLKDDLDGKPEEMFISKGLEILDWVHNESHLYINPIRTDWKQHFLMQGSFQQLSEELKVGWHPLYFDILTSKMRE